MLRLRKHHKPKVVWKNAALHGAAFLMLVLLCGFVSGMWISFTLCPEDSIAWFAAPSFSMASKPWKGVVVAVIYCAIILSMQYASGKILLDRMRARSWKTVLVFLAIQIVVAFLGMKAAIMTDKLMLGAVYEAGKVVIISFITLTFTLLFNVSYYTRVLNRELRAAESSAIRSELKALRAQVNPHFLFNALNSIAGLIRLRPSEAEEVTEHLADLFRYSLRSSERTVVALADELESVRLYLAIESSRFPDRLHVEYDVAPELYNASVPSLLLQPLVENAVKHGLNRSEDSCLIRLRGSVQGDAVLLQVHDTGPGFGTLDREILFARGTGLFNVHQRLKLQFGTRAELRIRPNTVELEFPFIRDALPAESAHPAPARAIFTNH